MKSKVINESRNLLGLWLIFSMICSMGLLETWVSHHLDVSQMQVNYGYFGCIMIYLYSSWGL